MRTWMRWAAGAAGVGLALMPMTSGAEETEALEKSEQVPRTLVLALPSVGLPSVGLLGLSGQLGVGVEHAVSSHVTLAGAVQLSGGYTVTKSVMAELDDSTSQMWGVGVEPGVHFFFAGRAPEGFWVGPHLELSTSHQASRSQYLYPNTPNAPIGEFVVGTSEAASRTVFYGGSARLGYTAIVASGVTLQVSAGLWALSGRYTSFGPPSVSGGLGWLGLGQGSNWSVTPRMSVGFGWAF